jgi:hypothetical protein
MRTTVKVISTNTALSDATFILGHHNPTNNHRALELEEESVQKHETVSTEHSFVKCPSLCHNGFMIQLGLKRIVCFLML